VPDVASGWKKVLNVETSDMGDLLPKHVRDPERFLSCC
jgi:hypothetical protein